MAECCVCVESCNKFIKCLCNVCPNIICKKCLEQWFIINKDESGPRCICGNYGYNDLINYKSARLFKRTSIISPDTVLWLKYQLKKSYNWNDKFIVDSIVQYTKFMLMKFELNDIEGKILYPSNIIDKIWSVHIGDNIRYLQFLQRIGKNIYRYTANSIDEESQYINNYALTYSLLSSKSIKLIDIWEVPKEILSKIQIFIKCLDGTTKTIDCNSDEEVFIFKYRVYRKTYTPIEQIRAVFCGRYLIRGKLSDYKIQDCSTIHLVLSIKGD